MFETLSLIFFMLYIVITKIPKCIQLCNPVSVSVYPLLNKERKDESCPENHFFLKKRENLKNPPIEFEPYLV